MTDNDDLEASTNSASQPIQIQDIRIEPSMPMHQGETQLANSQVQVSISAELAEAIEKVRFVTLLVGYFYIGLVALLSVVAVILLAPVAIAFLDQHSPILMMAARIMISLVAFALGIGAWIILLNHWRINDGMETAEILIDSIRDQTLIQMQAARFNLEDLTERLRFPKDAQAAGPLEYIEMAKQIGPLLSLLMAKERSILTLGVEGLKFFQLVKKVLNK
ncbi:MAG: hypothetical protein Q8T09_09045 [Candidatus Melainabacteria bacterium]|nr:hypothetical protein [Candidatus Melainabacteria bacterium]